MRRAGSEWLRSFEGRDCERERERLRDVCGMETVTRSSSMHLNHYLTYRAILREKMYMGMAKNYSYISLTFSFVAPNSTKDGKVVKNLDLACNDTQSNPILT